MDRIRMFYSNIDTKPRVLITHFVRFLGFYVDGITNKDNIVLSNVESMMDIYIISDAYVEERTISIDVEEEEKSILIYLDGWRAEDLKNAQFINYEDQADRVFLKQFSRCMLRILSRRLDRNKKLINSTDNLGKLLEEFIKQYIENEILQITLFGRCFRAYRDFYRTAQMQYRAFTSWLDQNAALKYPGDLTKYMCVRSKYEVDLICKVNHFELYFDPTDLREECEELLRKYVDNETLHILQADISFELSGVWNKAGNEYADIRLDDCAYAYLKQGNILQNYVRDLNSAVLAYRVAAQEKEDYYLAWFQMGECYVKQNKYSQAIKAYEQVCSILSGRYYRHVLAPLEIEHLYDAVVKIAAINEVKIKNYALARHYRELAKSILEEIDRDDYFRLVWDDEKAYQKYFSRIKKKMKIEIEGKTGDEGRQTYSAKEEKGRANHIM